MVVRTPVLISFVFQCFAFMSVLLGVLSTRVMASTDLGDILHFSRSA